MSPDRPYALLDYPAYANVGDNAIWLGTLEALRQLGAGPPAYTCCADTYHADSLRRRVQDGPVLIKGGGNFGDLYPRHQRLRERVVRDFPDNPIVQLPQTVAKRLHSGRKDQPSESRQLLALGFVPSRGSCLSPQ